MATSTRAIRCLACQSVARPAYRSTRQRRPTQATHASLPRKSFHTSFIRSASRDDNEALDQDNANTVQGSVLDALKSSGGLTAEEATKFEQQHGSLDNEAQAGRAVDAQYQELQSLEPSESEQIAEPHYKDGFYAMDEDADDRMPDPEFEADDITSMAHAELEQHREMREYARVIAWDMPLLWKHTQPFEPPTKSQPLRFRYTTYLGETHPGSRKVVMEFCPADVGSLRSFSETQTAKLIKLLGARYNPETQVAKMSSDMFATTAQNKRYLGDLLDKLLKEVAEGKDTFEDIPFDFRHHTSKPKFTFPEEWKMTEERRAALDAKRQLQIQAQEDRIAVGELVDGGAIIQRQLERLTVPVEAPQQQRLGGSQRQRAR